MEEGVENPKVIGAYSHARQACSRALPMSHQMCRPSLLISKYHLEFGDTTTSRQAWDPA